MPLIGHQSHICIHSDLVMVLSLQVVKGLLYLWELKIMHRGKHGLEFELVLFMTKFIQSPEKTVVVFSDM